MRMTGKVLLLVLLLGIISLVVRLLVEVDSNVPDTRGIRSNVAFSSTDGSTHNQGSVLQESGFQNRAACDCECAREIDPSGSPPAAPHNEPPMREEETTLQLDRSITEPAGSSVEEMHSSSSTYLLPVDGCQEDHAFLPVRLPIDRFCACCSETLASSVVVLTYGRSGSTLLTAVLNTIPGYTIRGESLNYLRTIFDLHRLLTIRSLEEIERLKDGGVDIGRSPFHGIENFNETETIPFVRDLFVCTILKPEPTARVIGFKEITIGNLALSEASALLDFYKAVMPSPVFVFNFRDLNATAKSGWWAWSDGSVLFEADELIRNLSALDRGIRNCSIVYDDYRDNALGLLPLFDCLGEAEHFNETAIEDVLSQKHSY